MESVSKQLRVDSVELLQGLQGCLGSCSAALYSCCLIRVLCYESARTSSVQDQTCFSYS